MYRNSFKDYCKAFLTIIQLIFMLIGGILVAFVGILIACSPYIVIGVAMMLSWKAIFGG